MIVKWDTQKMFSLKIDGIIIQDVEALLLLSKGLHHFEFTGMTIPLHEFKRKIYRGWISGLCGAVIYTLDDAFKDILDRRISFDLFVTDKTKLIDVDVIRSSVDMDVFNLHQESVVNKSRLKCFKRIMVFPVVILCFALSGIFITLGLVTAKRQNYFAGYFAISIGLLVLSISILSIIKFKRQFNSLCR